MIEFFHPCIPPTATAQQRRHNRSGATYMPPSVRLAAARLQAAFEMYAPETPIAGPVHVVLYWTFPSASNVADGVSLKATRPDLDNLAKLALDAMTAAGYWHDDAQVARLDMAKFVGPLSGIYVSIDWDALCDDPSPNPMCTPCVPVTPAQPEPPPKELVALPVGVDKHGGVFVDGSPARQGGPGPSGYTILAFFWTRTAEGAIDGYRRGVVFPFSIQNINGVPVPARWAVCGRVGK